MKLPGYGGALLMILPPGGFCRAGLFILAGKRAMELRQAPSGQGHPAARRPAFALLRRLTKPSWRCCPTVCTVCGRAPSQDRFAGFCEPL